MSFIEKKNGFCHMLPFLIINLGGEMAFIIDQRLRSQTVEKSRAQRVLQDIVKSMFEPKFMDEVFRSQPMYSLIEAR